ncbi:hypothetical protein FISHEDRAFT_77083 [Fistulina hepatica ATCC 64428]|uniref:Uncharacterized protein n=1 Tax=Fistulina hepatica ATCC 64428 TaxID=1128425 RepID=A0A0D7A1I2_9AGAR|nr:hypothetical protein FISHEDRAFT_77083 [Fistulina hepatica ATCC 64428]
MPCLASYAECLECRTAFVQLFRRCELHRHADTHLCHEPELTYDPTPSMLCSACSKKTRKLCTLPDDIHGPYASYRPQVPYGSPSSSSGSRSSSSSSSWTGSDLENASRCNTSASPPTSPPLSSSSQSSHGKRSTSSELTQQTS